MQDEQSKVRIVIVGGGFGGAYCAQELEKRLDPDEVEVVLLDRHNYFVFFPLLIEAGIGKLEPRHAVVSIRAFLRHTTFRMAEVTGLDSDSQMVRYRIVGDSELRTLHYDHLVLALGSVNRLPPLPGLVEYAYQIKSLPDALLLRDRVIQLLEWADAITDREKQRTLLHFVVVGGNFTGVEVAGEFLAFMQSAARKYKNINPGDCCVTLFERAERILPAVGAHLANYAAKHLIKHGMVIHLNQSVLEIGADYVVSDSGERIGCRTVIWCAGIAPPPLVATTHLAQDSDGWVRCERDFRVEGHSNIWAIGDCAVNRDADGNPYTATAQNAVRMGPHLARNLVFCLRKESTKPFDFKMLGSLTALGSYKGVARIFGFNISGWPAWFLWRTVYLLKMPGWRRRLRVAIDWTLDLLSAQDNVQIGLSRDEVASRKEASRHEED